MALNGEEAPTIAAAVRLSEPRVAQVLENVLASGFPALYPAFVEEVPLPDGFTGPTLWKILQPIIDSSPSSRNVRASRWNPAFLLEHLITQGTLEDLSNSGIERIIRRYLDPEKTRNSMTFEYADSGHTPPSTNASTWGPILGLAFGILILTIAVSAGIVFVGLFAVLVIFLFANMLVKQLLEIRLLRRVIAHNEKHAAAAPAAAAPAQPLHPAVHNPVPPPPITILHAASLPAVPWKLDLLSDTTNALGQTPVKVLYLWVFAAQADQGGYETEGWPQIGPVHLLLNATALRIGQLMGDLDKLLVADQSTLDATIAAYDDRAGTYKRPMLFVMGAIGKYLYRGFPIHTLVCNDAVWKPAVHQLAARCDLAVVNLSGFNPSHPGLEYEILHLLSGGPPRQFVFIYERYTDADAVISMVLELWARLDPRPATTPELLFLRVPDSQNTGYAVQFLPPGKKPGWVVRSMIDREGEYLPIAPRILAYLDDRASARAPEAQAAV